MTQLSRFVRPTVFTFVALAACNSYEPQHAEEGTQSLSLVSEDPASLELAEDLSVRHVMEVDPQLLQGVDTIQPRLVTIDELGQAHTRIRQMVADIPVFGGEAVVHLNDDGSFHSMTDDLIRDIDVNPEPVLHELDALDIAVEFKGGWERVSGLPEADLQILRRDDGDHLTYRVQITQFEPGFEPAKPVVFIDAHTGEQVWEYNDLKTTRSRITYDANSAFSLPGTLMRYEVSENSGDPVLDQVHENSGIAYNYFRSAHLRDSWDGEGARIMSSVHFDFNYVNAFWDGTYLVYGDGDGVVAGPLTVLDIVGHELTHAVTERSSGLIYANESGAINEAMSDIFAAAIEAYNDGEVTADTWLVGEDSWTPGTVGDALRYMDDPTIDGASTDYYPTRYVGPDDNGGVHWNSGIANLAFYLLSEGGTHPRGMTTTVVTGIGIEDAAQIFYRANTVYLTPGSTFADLREATVLAATDLYGNDSEQVEEVANAWAAVGV